MAKLVAIRNKRILELNVPVPDNLRLESVAEPQYHYWPQLHPDAGYIIQLIPIGRMEIDKITLVFDELLRPTIEPAQFLYEMQVSREGHVTIQRLFAQCNYKHSVTWIGREIVFEGTISQLADAFEYHWLYDYAQNAMHEL